MKYLFIILFASCSTCSFSQTKSRLLKIYSITEYADVFVLKAIDTAKLDTLNIISIRDAPKCKKGLKRIKVGKLYNIMYEENNMAPQILLDNNLVIKVKKTLIWKPSDGLTNLPVYSTNLKGLWISDKNFISSGKH